MLIGIDACQDEDKVYHAYNDQIGKTHEFVLNALSHINRLDGTVIFNVSDWKVIGEYDETAGRHQAFLSPVKDLLVEDTMVSAGERIRIEESYKYSPLQTEKLWWEAGLAPLARYGDKIDQYRKYNVPSFQSHPLLRIVGTLITIRTEPYPANPCQAY